MKRLHREPSDGPHAWALRVLGVSAEASWAQVVSAHRRLVRLHHPDLFASGDAGELAEAEQRTKELNAALALLDRVRLTVDGGSVSDDPPRRVHDAEQPYAFSLASDALAIDGPADQALASLAEAAALLGTVTLHDRRGLVEVVVGDAGVEAFTAVLSVQGRADFTEVFVTLEGPQLPPVGMVVDALAELVNDLI